VRIFFIKYHKKIDVYCITTFLYFVMVLAMIPLTSFIENEYFRAAIVLIIPIIFSRKKYGEKINFYIHRIFRLEE